MTDHVYKLTEIVGSSMEGTDQAIKAALARAAKTLHNIHWFEVTGTRGMVDRDGAIQFQVSLKVGFTLDD